MKPYKVFVGYPILPEAEAALATFCDFHVWNGEGVPREEDIIALTKDVDAVLFDGAPRLTRRVIEQATRLKVASNASIGYNNWDLEAMKERQMIGTNVAGAADDSVADLALALMLCSGRRICELDRLVRDGRWAAGDERPFFGAEIHHKTLGIIGMGRIGEAVVQRAKFGFGMSVLYHNRSRKPDAEARLGVEYAALDDLLAKSDYVVLITPYTPETHHLMGAAQFARMKKSAFFINVSRGRNVDEPALIEALQNGTIAGAGLDVFYNEPVSPDNPLLKLDQVVTVPHIGTATRETRLLMSLTAIENLRQALSGIKPALTVPELR